MTDAVSFNTFDPFADELTGGDEIVQKNIIHIRVFQRTGRKRITTVEGLSEDFDLKRLVKAWKKEFQVGGSIDADDDGPSIIKLSGDVRAGVREFIVREGIAEEDRIIVHGA